MFVQMPAPRTLADLIADGYVQIATLRCGSIKLLKRDTSRHFMAEVGPNGTVYDSALSMEEKLSCQSRGNSAARDYDIVEANLIASGC